jgi:hypothetical protein
MISRNAQFCKLRQEVCQNGAAWQQFQCIAQKVGVGVDSPTPGWLILLKIGHISKSSLKLTVSIPSS